MQQKLLDKLWDKLSYQLCVLNKQEPMIFLTGAYNWRSHHWKYLPLAVLGIWTLHFSNSGLRDQIHLLE